MFIVKKLEDALLALLANSLESAEEAEDAMDNVDMDALTRALCHSARTVYSYEVESNGAFGFRYRGDELFGQRAALLYREMEEGVADVLTACRYLELWVLDDNRLVLCSDVEVCVKEGEYSFQPNITAYAANNDRRKYEMTKLIALALTLCLCLCMSVSAFAAEVDTSGGSGSTPVHLTTTSDGTEGGEITPTAMRVTVPTALPMAMSQDGAVTTANNCQIVNNSYGAVRVKSVTISAANGWTLTAFGDKSSLASEKVDSNKLGFAVSIGGGQQRATDASNAATQALVSSPITGCYMTGVGDLSGNTVSVNYAAIVTPLSSAVNEATVANVVFVIEWDTVA